MDENDFGDILSSAPEAVGDESAETSQTQPGYFFRLNGEQFGPVLLQELQDLINAGTMTFSDRVRKDGSAAWIPSDQIERLVFPTHQDISGPVTPKSPSNRGNQSFEIGAPLEPDSALEAMLAGDESAVSEVSNEVTLTSDAALADKAGSSGESNPDWWDALAAPMPDKKSPKAPVTEIQTQTSSATRRVPPSPVTSPQTEDASSPSALSGTHAEYPDPKGTPSRKPATKHRKDREPLSIQLPSSPLVYVLAGLLVLAAVVCLLPSSVGVSGTVRMEGLPVPVGSITLKPKAAEDAEVLTVSVIDGKFSASDDARLPTGPCEITVVIGDAFGSRVAALESSPRFSGLSGGKYEGSIETTAGSSIDVEFSAGEIKVTTSSEEMPTEAL